LVIDKKSVFTQKDCAPVLDKPHLKVAAVIVTQSRRGGINIEREQHFILHRTPKGWH
jgi:hypothetical protein